jgi:hypothetical protein
MMVAIRERQWFGSSTLWLPLLLGPFLWALTEVVLYPVSAQECYTGFIPAAQPPAATGTRLFGGIWVIVAIVLSALATLLAIRSWRSVRGESTDDDAVVIRVRFMALAGVIVSAVFLYANVMYGIGVALVAAPCG